MYRCCRRIAREKRGTAHNRKNYLCLGQARQTDPSADQWLNKHTKYHKRVWQTSLRGLRLANFEGRISRAKCKLNQLPWNKNRQGTTQWKLCFAAVYIWTFSDHYLGRRMSLTRRARRRGRTIFHWNSIRSFSVSWSNGRITGLSGMFWEESSGSSIAILFRFRRIVRAIQELKQHIIFVFQVCHWLGCQRFYRRLRSCHGTGSASLGERVLRKPHLVQVWRNTWWSTNGACDASQLCSRNALWWQSRPFRLGANLRWNRAVFIGRILQWRSSRLVHFVQQLFRFSGNTCQPRHCRSVFLLPSPSHLDQDCNGTISLRGAAVCVTSFEGTRRQYNLHAWGQRTHWCSKTEQ